MFFTPPTIHYGCHVAVVIFPFSFLTISFCTFVLPDFRIIDIESYSILLKCYEEMLKALEVKSYSTRGIRGALSLTLFRFATLDTARQGCGSRWRHQ
ncbi:hypothetical protein XENTR_v10017440 [Xenopus tropicalis]|nr:hypothetical protein XENTR_v10017440 [Xenopus tropicalis]